MNKPFPERSPPDNDASIPILNDTRNLSSIPYVVPRMIEMLGIRLLSTLVLLFVTVCGSVFAEHRCCPHCGCAGGCVTREVTQVRCHIEKEVKPIKKTVYETKQIPVCQKKLPKFLHRECCAACADCPTFKTVLIKKEIECGEKCTWKCVPEETKVTVLVPCRRCGHRPPRTCLQGLYSQRQPLETDLECFGIDTENTFAEDENLLEEYDTESFEPVYVAVAD